MDTQQAIDTVTWIATHKPLLELSLMLTEWLANQMMSKSSQSWLSRLVGWNTNVNMTDIAHEAYRYEMDLIFGKPHAPPVDNVIGVLSQVNSIVSGVKLPQLPTGINIASVLGTLNGSASRLAELPAALPDDEAENIRRVLAKAQKNHQSTLSDADLAALPASSKEWIRLGHADLMSSDAPSKDNIVKVYNKWRKWGQTHQHTVWNALTAGSLADSEHWGKLPGRLTAMTEGENHVLDFLKTALHTVADEYSSGRQWASHLIEKSKQHADAQASLPTPAPPTQAKPQAAPKRR